MSKRFTDTDKWKKDFIKSLPPSYKLFWLYLLDECDHAGIWHKEVDVASIRLGVDLDEEKAIELFSDHVVEFDGGEKWFISDFVDFQYGTLNPDNRAHNSVIKKLKKYGLLDKNHKPLTSPLQAPSHRAMDKDMDKDKEIEGEYEGEKYSIYSEHRWDQSQPIDYKSFVDKFNSIYDRDGSSSLRVTTGKREQIRSRLRVFTGSEILTSWENRLHDEWLLKEGRKFLNDWESAMRNDEKIERYLTSASNGEPDDSLFQHK